ncbi:MAG TPA: thioesterase family protein [Candidatus Saccharimonadia bacterium]|nr:thioesterase family protein [Candidatus Saccharimonadia bacterium]
MTDDFRHRMSLEVRFRDIDALRHVNNASFFTYLEEARIHYFIDLLHAEAFERLPLILAAVQIDFRSPILFGQVVDIGTQVDWIGTTSISMSHRMTASPDDRLVAEADTVLVCYDYQANQPTPVPDAWRSAFAAWEGRDLVRPAEAHP